MNTNFYAVFLSIFDPFPAQGGQISEIEIQKRCISTEKVTATHRLEKLQQPSKKTAKHTSEEMVSSRNIPVQRSSLKKTTKVMVGNWE